MPKRIVDGEGLWGSDKLGKVAPPAFRAEYAWLLPLALANGTFEAHPQRVWSRAYAFGRPDVSAETVGQILDAFEAAKLLFRWTDAATGKVWGFWVGIDKPGRLPGKSRHGKNEAVGLEPPADQLRAFLGNGSLPVGNEPLPSGNEKFLGFGLGLGKGNGFGEQAETPAFSLAPFEPGLGSTTKGSRLPEDFSVTEEHRAFAQKEGLPSPDRLIGEFHDYWRQQPGQKGVKSDWDAAFRSWIRKAPSFSRQPNQTNPIKYRHKSPSEILKEQYAAVTHGTPI